MKTNSSINYMLRRSVQVEIMLAEQKSKSLECVSYTNHNGATFVAISEILMGQYRDFPQSQLQLTSCSKSSTRSSAE